MYYFHNTAKKLLLKDTLPCKTSIKKQLTLPAVRSTLSLFPPQTRNRMEKLAGASLCNQRKRKRETDDKRKGKRGQGRGQNEKDEVKEEGRLKRFRPA